MTQTLQQTLAAATLAASSVTSPPAQALTFHVEASGTSQVVEVVDPAIPVLRFATQAEGSGGFGITGYLSTDVVNMATGKGSGTNRFIASNGDELRGNFTVQVIPTPTAGSLRIEGLTQFIGGTGIFDGASGSASFVGTGNFISDSKAVVHFVHDGNLALVPEPASAALLLGGLAAVAAAARRRQQD